MNVRFRIMGEGRRAAPRAFEFEYTFAAEPGNRKLRLPKVDTSSSSCSKRLIVKFRWIAGTLKIRKKAKAIALT